jgi:hypothetical protein
MKGVWRFIVSCRYLLLACLVLAAAGNYLFSGRRRPGDALAPQPSSLRVNYEKVQGGMTESEVLEVLGPPQRRREGRIEGLDLKALTWEEGQDALVVSFGWGEPVTVKAKHFYSGSGQEAHYVWP